MTFPTPGLSRLADAVAVLLAAVLIWFIGYRFTSHASPAQDPQNNAIESKRLDPSFAWEVEDADDPKKEVLHIRYVDGRRYGFRVASITSYQFFPASSAKMLGYNSPALKIQVGASSLRLDITNEEATELMRLFSETRPGEAGSNIKSSAK